MKKLLSVLLSVLMVFALAGCSKKVTVDSLLGSYQDSVSQRATAEVGKVDDNTVEIEIHWSSSAENSDEWIIKAKIDGKKLTYDENDFTHFSITGETSTIVENEPAGYFEVKDGKLAWTGSGVDATATCVFEKVQ